MPASGSATGAGCGWIGGAGVDVTACHPYATAAPKTRNAVAITPSRRPRPHPNGGVGVPSGDPSLARSARRSGTGIRSSVAKRSSRSGIGLLQDRGEATAAPTQVDAHRRTGDAEQRPDLARVVAHVVAEDQERSLPPR